MRIPFITRRSPKGGGRGHGKGSSGGSTGGSGKGGSTSKTGRVPDDRPFSGRPYGGGTREDVSGTRLYGSGYPATYGSSPQGQGFPYGFWPLVWGNNTHTSTSPGNSKVLVTENEYGGPDNSSRPGGVLTYIFFTSNDGGTTLRFLSDKMTTWEMLGEFAHSCSSLYSPSDSSNEPVAYHGSTKDEWPLPEQVFKYYRASTAALTLDGYNNIAALAPSVIEDTALPTNIVTGLMICFDQAVAENIPLSNSSPPFAHSSGTLLLFSFLLIRVLQ